MWNIFSIFIVQILYHNYVNSQGFNVRTATSNEHYSQRINSPSFIDNPFQPSSDTYNNFKNHRNSNAKNQIQYNYVDHNGMKIGHFWWSCSTYNCGRGK
uniref:Uncharacterized protein n=1 Tax=Strongyloides papillosus TaxID=174720 RepID=A0A0N5BXS2_STREA